MKTDARAVKVSTRRPRGVSGTALSVPYRYTPSASAVWVRPAKSSFQGTTVVDSPTLLSPVSDCRYKIYSITDEGDVTSNNRSEIDEYEAYEVNNDIVCIHVSARTHGRTYRFRCYR